MKLRILALLLVTPAFSQVSVVPIVNPKVQFLCEGDPCAGGFLYTYAAGTTTPLATYQDLGATVNSDPIVLDANGQAVIFLKAATAYKFVLQDANSVQQWSQDNVLPGNTCWTQSGGSGQWCLSTVNNVLTFGPAGSGLNSNGDLAAALGFGIQFWNGTLAAGTVDTGLYRCAARVLCAGNGTFGDTSGSFEGTHFFVPSSTITNPTSTTTYFTVTVPATAWQVGSVIHWKVVGTYVSGGSASLLSLANTTGLETFTIANTSSATWAFFGAATCVITTTANMFCSEDDKWGAAAGSTSLTVSAVGGNVTVAVGSPITFSMEAFTGWTGSLTLSASVVDISY